MYVFNARGWRACNDPASAGPGEKFFDHWPTQKEVTYAFPDFYTHKDIPVKVSKAQGKLALLDVDLGNGSTLLDVVEQTIAGSTDRALKIWYDDANDWYRDNPQLNSLASTLGLTSDQIDTLFLNALAKGN